jgi:acyl dehydratase
MGSITRELKAGDHLDTVTRQVTTEKMVEFEKVVWDRGRNSHSDPVVAKADGISRTIASGQNQMAFLHEMMEMNFGDAWVYGGRISVRYVRPVYAGDRITPHGIVAGVSDTDGKARVTLSIWCENQDGHKTAAGTASAGQPSASRSWIDANAQAAS